MVDCGSVVIWHSWVGVRAHLSHNEEQVQEMKDQNPVRNHKSEIIKSVNTHITM